MRYGRVYLLIVVLCFLALSNGLKTVTVKQLEQLVPKSEFVVVVLYSNVEHLKEMSTRVNEEVDRIATVLEKVKFYALSLDDHPELMAQLQIYDVPSILIYRDGHPRVYYGQRTGMSIYTFLNELLTADPIKLITHKQDKKQFTSEDHVKVVGYITKEGDILETFKQAAKQFQGDISFGLVQDPKIAKTFKLKSEGDILIDKPGERAIHSESAFTSREDLIHWVHSNKKPLWATLTYTNIYSVWQGSKVTFVAFLKNLEEHQSKTVLATFKSLAKQYGPQNDYSFVIVNTGLYKEFAQSLGLS
jgi:hypothetical protein